jgi:hypothetical protein
MISLFDPKDWYWKASDGRLYKSKTGEIVSESDQDYVNWQTLGSAPAWWPADASEQQTNESLGAVLDQYNLTVK